MNTQNFSLHQNAAVDDGSAISYFGITDTRGKHVPFGIKQEDRSRHSYVIGKTGMGKSTLLENLAVQDIQQGRGLCFIDPHGSTAEKLMEYIPEDRVKDVLYFAPFDMQYPISFNVLEDVGPDKRHFVVAGLMSTFEKIWVDAWSARMAYILQNTLAALLEFPGATLLGVNRMYIDKEYRKNVIAHVTDPATRSFWVDEYSKYTDRYAQEATPAIQNKIGQFAANALVRNIIGQEQSAFDVRDLMDNRKIFIANLSKGRMGEGNANLLGSMLITKIYLSAMSRADAAPSLMRELPPFYLYVDEFQNFANKSFADILSEARKYKLALTVAHQYIEQMEDEVRAAVFGNVGTMMTFRVGSYDAEVLEKEFAPIFTADDLVNLGRYQLYLKLMIDGVSSQPFSASTMTPIPEPEVSHRDRAVAFSRAQYSRPRAEVEKDISDWTARKYEDPEAEEKEKARAERRAAREAEENKPPRERMQGAPRRDEGSRPPRPRERDSKRDGGSSTPRGDRPAPRERRSDAPSRSDAPRSSTPRGAPTEAPNKDLKQFLSVLKQEEAPVPAKAADDSKGRTVPSARPAGREGGKRPPQQVAQPAQSTRADAAQGVKSSQSREDDGKGISPEGRDELRALLSKLRETSSAQSNGKKTPAPNQAQASAADARRPQEREGVKTAPKAAKPSGERAHPRQTPQGEVGNRQSAPGAPTHAPGGERPPRGGDTVVSSAQPKVEHQKHVPIEEVSSAPEQGGTSRGHATHVPVSDATHRAEAPARTNHTTHVPVEDATPSATEVRSADKTHLPVEDVNNVQKEPSIPRGQATHVPIADATPTPRAVAPARTSHTTHVRVEDAAPKVKDVRPGEQAHVPVTDANPQATNTPQAANGQVIHVTVEEANPQPHATSPAPHEHTTHVPIQDATPHSKPAGKVTQQQSTQAPGATAPGIPVEELRRRLKVQKPNLDR